MITKKPFHTRAVAPLIYVAALAVIGIATWVAKPSLFPGASRRAAQSTKTTDALVKTTDAQGSSAAASVVKIGEANSAAPDSPSKNFITSEVQVALARLPAPDAQSLLDAERRRSAVMEGRIEEARRLYEQSAKTSAKLQAERDEALADKRASDLALEQSAAAGHARNVQLAAMGVLACLGFAGWFWTKRNGISFEAVGGACAGIRSGEDPIAAISRFVPHWHHGTVQKHAKLAMELPESRTSKTS